MHLERCLGCLTSRRYVNNAVDHHAGRLACFYLRFHDLGGLDVIFGKCNDTVPANILELVK